MTNPSTILALDAALGTLLERIAEADMAPLLDAAVTTWHIGRRPSASVGLNAVNVGDFDPASLPRLADLIDGTVTCGSTITHDHDGSRTTNRIIEGEWSGVAVEISVWIPAPPEREQLLARLEDREQIRDLTDQRDGARRTVEDQQREYAAARLPRRDACRERCAEAGLARCCLTSGHTGAHETDWSGGQHVSWGGAA
jgi:hypothetical protein